MTTFENFTGRTRNEQDGVERHVFGDVKFSKTGAIVRARGTGTEDQEMPLLNFGYGMNFTRNFNTEVISLSLGSDTTQKYAMLTIPRDKQREWKPGTGGVQNPNDPKKALEFNDKRTHLTDGNYAVGNGEFEVKGGKIIFRGDLFVAGKVHASGGYVGPDKLNEVGAVDVPGFEA